MGIHKTQDINQTYIVFYVEKVKKSLILNF